MVDPFTAMQKLLVGQEIADPGLLRVTPGVAGMVHSVPSQPTKRSGRLL